MPARLVSREDSGRACDVPVVCRAVGVVHLSDGGDVVLEAPGVALLGERRGEPGRRSLVESFRSERVDAGLAGGEGACSGGALEHREHEVDALALARGRRAGHRVDQRGELRRRETHLDACGGEFHGVSSSQGKGPILVKEVLEVSGGAPRVRQSIREWR